MRPRRPRPELRQERPARLADPRQQQIGTRAQHRRDLLHHVELRTQEVEVQIDGGTRRLGQRAGQRTLERWRLGCGERRQRWRRRHGLRADLVHRLREQHGRAAVHHRVMDLGVERRALPRQTLYDIELPERPRPIEQDGVQPRDRFVQLRVGARRGQDQPTDMIVEIDVLVRIPARVIQMQRRRVKLLPQDRHQRHPTDQEVPVRLEEPAAVGFRQVQQVQAGDVHRRLRRFQIKECCVQPTQPCHAAFLPQASAVWSRRRTVRRMIFRQPGGNNPKAGAR